MTSARLTDGIFTPALNITFIDIAQAGFQTDINGIRQECGRSSLVIRHFVLGEKS